ncbi:ATP-binding cassette domain-containing protein [Streptomyces sp. NBC_01210]|uniref:ATP-binding cassette domain-containing protein n=1 Tax=Streptomyces sp. NBC_01210 TaxID=2903774 RepID=UPI002E112AB0|nr:ATP-binding cassette domain-containing protein [Streptomyces sp. NBC_01210]
MATVQVDALSKTFGEKVVVDGLRFTVEPGAVTGFLGPNGAGKSTTLRLMLELERGSGRTLFDGQRYSELADPAQRVGALLETRAYHPGRSVRAHLRMLTRGIGIPEKRIDEVLDLVGLLPVARHRPKGFSLGMLQRLGLACALLGSPDVLILDEPGNGMDPQGMRWLRTFLKEYAAAGNAVFVSSHQMSDLDELAERVVLIGKGRLICDSTLADFKRGYDGGAVRVRADSPDQLRRALLRLGADVESSADGCLLVKELTQREIAATALAENVIVTELTVAEATLEEAFLRASAASVEYVTDEKAGAR